MRQAPEEKAAQAANLRVFRALFQSMGKAQREAFRQAYHMDAWQVADALTGQSFLPSKE